MHIMGYSLIITFQPQVHIPSKSEAASSTTTPDGKDLGHSQVKYRSNNIRRYTLIVHPLITGFIAMEGGPLLSVDQKIDGPLPSLKYSINFFMMY